MIIFDNGAFKSGSTWLMHLALQLRPCVEPPQQYWNPAWKSRPAYSVAHGRLLEFLRDPSIRGQDIMVKFHHSSRRGRNAMLAHPEARVLNIRRDLRDVVVSAYHHQIKARGNPIDFEQYYWGHGRAITWKLLHFHHRWDIRSPRYLRLEYEELLADFPTQLRRLAAFLDVAIDDRRVSEIQLATSPQTLNQQYQFGDLNRFRKGGSGDWQNYLTDVHLADLELLTRTSRRLLPRLVWHNPVLRRLLAHWYNPPRRQH